MAKALKIRFRYSVQFPLQHVVDSVLARARTKPSAITRILIASDGASITSEQQFAPLFENRRRIIDDFAIVFDQRLIDDVLDSGPISARYSAVFAKLSFETPADRAIEKLVRLRCRMPHGVKLVYFDGDDDLCVQWSEMLPLVDLYVKKHVFADLGSYQKQFIGKSNLTDYVAKRFGRSFAQNPIPSTGPVPCNQLNKIFAGYNIGLDEKITALFRNTRPSMPSEKTVDVMCRAACAPDNWLYALRGTVGAALEPLSRQGFNVLLPDKRVDQDAYYHEMRSSKICISPFGYGELCWRDFETVLMGSLLVKPDVSHLRTEPNIFIPGETYVPVRWDYSDVAEVCARYLADERERNRITANAYRVLSNYYFDSGFLKCFSRLMRRADIQPFTRQAALHFMEEGN